MSNSNLQNSVEQFVRRGLDYLKSEHEKSVLKIQNNLKDFQKDIASREDAMSMSDWTPLETNWTPSCLVAPGRMRFGNLQVVGSEEESIRGLNIPFLLPTKVNAVMMNIEDDAEKVPNLFQNIILRLLLSMRMDLVKVSVVDMDFGSSFPVFSSLANTMFKGQLIYRQEDVTKLIESLSKEISEANKNFLGRFPDIDMYNANAGDMALPYHFVFIDDFPNGFTSQSIDGLYRLIDNGNAIRAGIRIFINFSKKNPQPREFDLRRFAKCCAWINREMDGSISIANWEFTIPPKCVAQLELAVTDYASEYVDFINNIKPRAISYSLDSWIENLKKSDKIWKGSTIEGINVPIGFITPTKYFDFYLANDCDGSCNDFFALIAGRPGYGKTVLLHNIIVNAAMKYSPDDLCLYLADFAEGASFSIYRDLPHVKSLMLANNKEYALRMLEDIVLETKKRSHLYQKAQKQYGKQITKLSEYRQVTNEKLPRILFIMDEFHTLFLSTDATTIRAKEELCNGIRQWRKFGISIILCTQSINGVNFGNSDTLITYRFALNLLEMDSKSVIRNDAAKYLTRKGQTIMNNTSDGNANMNVEFQSAFSTHYLDYVQYLAKRFEQEHSEKHIPFICESGTITDINENQELMQCLTGKMNTANPHYCDVYIGKPDLLRDTHTRIRYRRQQNSNTLLIGEDYKTLIYNVLLQFIQLGKGSLPNSKLYIVDCFNAGDPYQGAFREISSLSGNMVYVDSFNAGKQIDAVFDELERRKEAQKEGNMIAERIVLTILNTQNCYDLKPQPGKYGMEKSAYAKKLISLLIEGSPLGIHCILHGLSYEILFKLSDILDSTKHFSSFDNVILLKGADVSNMYLNGLKLTAPEEEGQVIVMNAKLDNEPYEQCTIYADVTNVKTDSTVKYISNLFEKYRYV